MGSFRLDDTDRRLLDVLRHDGRITNRTLARRLGLSESACSARLRRLKSAGLIVGYAAILSPTLMGHAVCAWLEMKLRDESPQAHRVFEALLHESEHVIAAYQTVEAGAYLVKVGAPDVAGVEHFAERVRAAGVGIEPIRRWLIVRRVRALAPG